MKAVILLLRRVALIQVGHMLRTKLADANEGGVAIGAGALDSVYLVEDM